MRKTLAIASLTLLLSATCQAPSWAGKVLERIEQTGTITAGARKDSIPFGYVNNKGEWVGYSLDILELIRREAERLLGKPIRLKLVEVTPENRFTKIKNGSIDIECGSTTFTWERQKIVDFSASYFASGTQMLTKKGSGLGNLESLVGKRIGVVPKTTNEQAIEKLQPKAKFVKIENPAEGFAKLQAGEIDGFVSDGISLEGLRLKAPNPNNYELVPEFPYAIESYACTLPEDESQWRDLVNYTLVKYMEGIVSDNAQAAAIYDRWFGPQGVTPYPQETLIEYFQGIINGFEWIPIPD